MNRNEELYDCRSARATAEHVTYRVRWKQSAVDRLAELWIEAADRTKISAAVEGIDRNLVRDPALAGESRSATTRICFVPPIGVFFDVNDVDRIVSVLRVWAVLVAAASRSRFNPVAQ